ncbi:TlpA disulfide reductase family protein [Streptomyces sp. NPDC002671]
MILSRLPRRTAMLAATITAGAILLSACSDRGVAKSDGQSTGADGISIVPMDQRQATGSLRGETIGSKKLDVADYRGRVVVINVWGSWCPPCRAEAPDFAKVAKDTVRDGVTFVGIDTRDNSREQGRSFVEDFGIDYPSLYDPYGKIALRGFPKGTINPQTLPSTIVLDRRGRIVARALQPLTEESLRKMNSLVMKK